MSRSVLTILCMAACFFTQATFAAAGAKMLEYSPTEPEQVTLENPEGRSIKCELVDYDFNKELLKIRLLPQRKLMTVNPTIFDTDSQQLIENWKMQKAIYDYLIISARRSNKKDAGFNPSYDVSLRNMGKTNLEGLEIRYRLYKKSAQHSTSTRAYETNLMTLRNKNAKNWKYLQGTEQVRTIPAGNKSADFQTASIPIMKSTQTTEYHTTTLYTSGYSTSSKDGEKRESNRDSLKGLSIDVYYKGTLIKRWYSDKSLTNYID